jgi:hypothetical protein
MVEIGHHSLRKTLKLWQCIHNDHNFSMKKFKQTKITLSEIFFLMKMDYYPTFIEQREFFQRILRYKLEERNLFINSSVANWNFYLLERNSKLKAAPVPAVSFFKHQRTVRK